MELCNLCPRKCLVNRVDNLGFCNQKNTLKVAKAYLHMWEEPCISGVAGSGTVFFSGCNLRCVYCQNYNISSHNNGKEITIERLSEIFIELQNKGALNINLVTPTHFVPQIVEALKLAKNNGLSIPIVYNTSGYESVDTLKTLNGLIDIYMPDFKYFNDEYAKKYSSCNNYFEIASHALEEMYKQVGTPIFDDNGIMKKGIIVRHLILPGLTKDSKKILEYLYNTYKDDIYISIMNQYTPLDNVKNYPEINRKVTNEEYNGVIDYAINLGIENAFIQEGETCKESFIPNFDYEGV